MIILFILFIPEDTAKSHHRVEKQRAHPEAMKAVVSYRSQLIPPALRATPLIKGAWSLAILPI